MDMLEGYNQGKSHQENKIEQGLEGSEKVSQTSIRGKSIPSRGNNQTGSAKHLEKVWWSLVFG